MSFAKRIILVFFTAIVATTKSAPSADAIYEGEERRFDSELDLKVFVRRKEKDCNGRCFQIITFTLPGGLSTDEVYVKCFTDYTIFNQGNEFWLGDSLYSDDPQRVYVFSEWDECILYSNENGSLVKKNLDDAKCKKIKVKLGREEMFKKLSRKIKETFDKAKHPSHSSLSLFPKHKGP